ncbi:MAG: DUF4157 domain-containing protein [Bacteroidia bacterium]|nr:DUF4157 domain-containing protein [Bacteroidia bacterium]
MSHTGGDIQAKLAVGGKEDPAEKEADKMAEMVMGKSPASVSQSFSPGIQAKSSSQGSQTAPEELESHVTQSKGKGKSMDSGTQQQMEGAFGADMSGVRIHEDESPASIGAFAYTSGKDVHFQPGAYQPGTMQGKGLLAHELTHVVQQGAVQRKQVDGNAQKNAGQFDHGISQFKSENSRESLISGQQNALGEEAPVQTRDNSGALRRCGGGGTPPPTTTPAAKPFMPAAGKKNTVLKGTYGDFTVSHGLVVDNTVTTKRAYEIQIDMKPNQKTEGSNIRFVQTVRRGTVPGTWSTKATDSGMSADRAARAAAGGWRVDRANPGTDKTPFYGHNKDAKGNVQNMSNSRPGSYKGNDVMLWDQPGIVDPSVLEFSSNAMDDRTGVSFGNVSWGFQYNSSTKTYKEETPALLNNGDARLAGQEAAYKKWNEVYGPDGTRDKTVDKVLVPEGKTNAAGVHLVKDYNKWDTTRIGKLPKETNVKTLSMNKSGSWRKVEITSGTFTGQVGWIMSRYFDQAY